MDSTNSDLAVALYNHFIPDTNLYKGSLTDADIIKVHEMTLNSLSDCYREAIAGCVTGIHVPARVVGTYMNLLRSICEKYRHMKYIDNHYNIGYNTYSLDNFNLSKRVVTILNKNGVYTVYDFISKYRLNHNYIESIKGLGREAFYEIQTELLNVVLFP